MTTLQVQKNRLATTTGKPTLSQLAMTDCLFNAHYAKSTQITKIQTRPTSVLTKYIFCHIKCH